MEARSGMLLHATHLHGVVMADVTASEAGYGLLLYAR